MPDWSWILIVGAVLALAVVVARVVVALSPRDASAGVDEEREADAGADGGTDPGSDDAATSDAATSDADADTGTAAATPGD